MIESTEYFRTSWRPVHWSGSRTTRTEIILWILCLIIYLISHSGLDVASINLIINNQIKYTGIFWSLILDLQAILIADTLNFILHWGLNILMNFFQWTDARLRYLDCLCLFVSNLQPVDSCNILTYCFLSFVVLSYRNYIYVTLCFTYIKIH